MPTVSDKASDAQKPAPWDSTAASAEKMQRLDRLANLGMLSAGMAHEIKNGMVAIKTFVDLLVQKNQEAELAEVVGRELQRINAIVTQMLRFAAPKAATFATVRMHDLLDHSLRLLQHQIGAKSDFAAEKLPGRAGHGARRRRAIAAGVHEPAAQRDRGDGHERRVDGQHGNRGRRKQLQIHIRDTGAGIARENLAQLFEPFFTTKANGTGLGLAISRRIALEHHGAIEVRSETAKGSTFTLSLPVSDAPENHSPTR